jgi:Domain of unknown function (DUF4291)
MHLHTSPYLQQKAAWPTQGRVILAQYDTESVIVYQAYRPAIGHFAAQQGYFGGEFKLSRMTWIKPNFLWMMYRSGWGTKTDQEVTLAIRLRRSAFDAILSQAVHSHYIPELYSSYAAWRTAIQTSQVRLQWDPDHNPSGVPQERRAIQLGLQGEAARQYARDWLLGIEDISEFVAAQHQHMLAKNYDALITPSEAPYLVSDTALAARLQLDFGVTKGEMLGNLWAGDHQGERMR